MTIVLIISLIFLSIAFSGPIVAAISLAVYVGYFIFVNARKHQFVSATLIALAGTLILLAILGGHAWAATATAPAPSSFSLAPIINLLGPSIGEVLDWLVGIVLSLLIGLLVQLLQHFKIQVDTARFDVIKASAKKIVNAWWAAKSASIAAQTFTSSDKTVVSLAGLVNDDVLPFVKKLGLSRDQIAVFVLAEIGNLQKAILPSLGTAAIAPVNPPPAVQK